MTVKEFYEKIPSIEEVFSAIKKLEEYGVKIVELAKSEGNKPIYALEYGKGDKRIVVVAGQHGSEPAPILASIIFMYKLIDNELSDTISRREAFDECRITIIPLVNPDGFAHLRKCLENCRAPDWRCECIRARLTSLLVDINRDWLLLKHNATRTIHRLVNTIDPHVILDLHEFYAQGGSPPKWAHETEGFNAYVTDTPYLGVSTEITHVSYMLAQKVRDAIVNTTGWPTRIIRPGNGLAVLPPIYLGTHFPIEGIPKLLVETWGVGLGVFLLYERINAHIETIASTLRFAIDNIDFIEKAKKIDKKYDRIVGEMFGSKYVIEGRELNEASRVLKQHGIEYVRKNNTIEVTMPQKYSRTALFLLDREYYPNKILALKNNIHIIDKLFDVKIRKH